MVEFRLDEKDKKILAELQRNSRTSFSQIGKTVKLPKNVVAYRVKRLVDSGFLNLFCTVINKERLGYIYSRLFLKFHNFNDEIEKKLLRFLQKQKGMHWIASLNGCYDFCITILAKNIKELNETYSQIIHKFNKYILDKELSIAAKMYFSPIRYIFGSSEKIRKKLTPKPKTPIKIDKTDFKIINLIKQNSRLPLLEISESLKLSPQTVRSRIKTLEKNKTIQGYRIRIEHKMLGFHHFHTFLNLSNVTEKEEEEIISFLRSILSTIKIVKPMGKYDLEFESLLKSHFDLYDIIAKIKNRFPEKIQHIDSALIYKIHDINTVRYSG